MPRTARFSFTGCSHAGGIGQKGGRNIATKAYIMIHLDKKVDEDGCLRAIEELQAMPEVDTVERVDGFCDLVVTVDAPQRVIFVANRIRTTEWGQGLERVQSGV